jgi:hypothetical protein
MLGHDSDLLPQDDSTPLASKHVYRPVWLPSLEVDDRPATQGKVDFQINA